MPDHATLPIRWLVPGMTVLALAATLMTIHAQDRATDPSGRWEFTYDTPAGARGGAGRTGRAGATTAPAVGRGAAATTARKVTLDLKVGPANTLTGTLELSATGRGGAPGGNPLRPVEIADGKVEGIRLSFSAWQFDGYSNRVRYDGVLNGNVLRLTASRSTTAGIEKIEATATRPPY